VTIGTRAIAALALAVVPLSVAACGHSVSTTTEAGAGGTPVATPGGSSVTVGAPGDAWIAVLASADDPSRLDPQRERVLAALGDVLEGSVVVSPGECLQGVPDRLADGYVLAIQRESREDVQALASQLRDPPSFTGMVTVACTD
jgi:hypothetical protein